MIKPKKENKKYHFENRAVVLELSVMIEDMLSLLLSVILKINNRRDSLSLGTQSSGLSFNAKANLLLDMKYLKKDDRWKFQKFMEIRNQFAHNLKVQTFNQCFQLVSGKNKLLITADPDSVAGKIDTVFVNAITKDKIAKIDSSDYKFRKLIDKQHLFLTEKVSLFQFEKPMLKETILGTKMAGFKEPIYELLGFSLQSFSIYDDKYELFETKYKSPISNNALKEYRYKILDTTSIDNREVIVLYFKDKNSRKGLEGLLYIDKENYAVAKAVMRIRGVLDITGVHEFIYLSQEKIWFPLLKNFKIVKGKSKDPIKILGGRIEFAADNDGTNSKKDVSDYTYVSSEMNVFDLEINAKLKIRKSSAAEAVA